ncbi:uncharacterized protein SPPG_02659 [Spizellomyces punctatus DAOM BR117]|uniref:ubiquitinyl hydrolase 1 n=1 Tax=Spizellomyces punctatus (strain DAOM BR117) TaxID=645134 RepID=A0A0L0HM51_SPIPD|nr:uncharacterized protein SPPG_02659 [Spizellomyces punctatus DAOM BR117]KND02167.1 hypothetical protein SPPG_02659 [Spizellomyces punctatus DAOM BR117]|eukprot:XP_016610206.1 hypothetical protein SPPG_02659 [Spizellomyces punctatus DAOM BR117]
MTFQPFTKQEGQLCAQHALNALLQGSYFTAVDLADLARQLDAQELTAMAEGNVGGVESEEYQRFLKEGSANYDDSGFFSVQVISNALRVWNLDITAIGSQQATAARTDPTNENAFICNLQEHWFTLRRFGGSPKRWYNLNSVFDGPEYVSETYLGLLLAQLENEGYSIFVVNGPIPQSEADLYAASDPVPAPSQIPKGNTKGGRSQPESSLQVTGTGVGSSAGGDDDLARAIAMSLGEEVGPMDGPTHIPTGNPEDEDLKRALEQSLLEGGVDSKTLKRAIDESLKEDEERLMNEALQASLQESAAASESLDPENIRRKRLERFGG